MPATVCPIYPKARSPFLRMMFQSFQAKTSPKAGCFQIFKDLSALFAEYICIISRLFSASSANLHFDENKKAV